MRLVAAIRPEMRTGPNNFRFVAGRERFADILVQLVARMLVRQNVADETIDVLFARIASRPGKQRETADDSNTIGY